MAIILDGNKLSQEIRSELTQELAGLIANYNPPKLSVVLVGDDPASSIYVRNKEKACNDVGMLTETIRMPANISQEQLVKQVNSLNEDPAVNGILVQLPLPKHINEIHVINSINPGKDVDGIHPLNLGNLAQGNPTFVPCTPLGIQQILLRNDIPTEGKHVVVCGRSNIVGKPIANLLMQRGSGANATVTVCHSRTNNLQDLTSKADILIAAIGQANFIHSDMIKENSTIIDVGINRIEDLSKKRGYRLVGDVDYDAVYEKAYAITPVPGGVGPMTITLKSWMQSNNLSGNVA
mgnify:CR=1 FL=1